MTSSPPATQPDYTAMLGLSGKVALITGGASGIGRSTAHLFSFLGMSVMIADLNEEAGSSTAAGITEAGGSAAAFKLDVRDAASCKAAVAATRERLGRFDVLFNSAGIVIPDDETGPTAEAVRKMFEVNTLGTFNMMSAAFGIFIDQNSGNVINMGSVAGEVAIRGRVGYCISKGGVHLATKAEALRVAQYNVRVNAIAPCRVYTEMVEGYLRASSDPAQMLRNVCSTQVSGVMAEPEDVANAAMFLASDLSRMMSGAILDLSNGWLAGHQGNPANLPPGFEAFRRKVAERTGLPV